MAPDVGAHERTDRDDVLATRANVVERTSVWTRATASGRNRYRISATTSPSRTSSKRSSSRLSRTALGALSALIRRP
jgi:hypothetical protein